MRARRVALESCTSPAALSNLGTGNHVFAVRAVDEFGGASAATSFSWTVDATPPPPATITTTPSNPSGVHVTFAFVDDEPGVGFLCAVDRVPSNPCTSPVSYDVAGGSHVFEVWARDALGNTSVATSFSWTVDSTPPTVTMIQPVADSLLTTTSVIASWSGSDDGSIARYDVFEGVGTAGLQTLVQSSTGTSYSRVGVPGTTYCEQVTAYDAVGNPGSGQIRCSAVPFDDLDPGVVYAGAVTPCLGERRLPRLANGLERRRPASVVDVHRPKVRDSGEHRAVSAADAVLLDGVVVATIDLYSAKSKTQYVLTRVVAPGTHTVTLAWSGTKNPASTGTAVNVDGIATIAS